MKKLFKTYAEADALLQSEGWLFKTDTLNTAVYTKGSETLVIKRANSKYWVIELDSKSKPVSKAVEIINTLGQIKSRLGEDIGNGMSMEDLGTFDLTQILQIRDTIKAIAEAAWSIERRTRLAAVAKQPDLPLQPLTLNALV